MLVNLLKTQPLTNSLTLGNQNSINFSWVFLFYSSKVAGSLFPKRLLSIQQKKSKPKKGPPQFILFLKI